MGLVVFILGNSGTGKSYSMRNFNPDELVIINVQGKILPFRNSAKYTVKNTDTSDEIISSMKLADASGKKVIVIDDFQAYHLRLTSVRTDRHVVSFCLYVTGHRHNSRQQPKDTDSPSSHISISHFLNFSFSTSWPLWYACPWRKE